MMSEQQQVRRVLEERIKQFKAWSDTKPKATGRLMIRKFPCKVDLLEYRTTDENKQPSAQALLRVTFSNQRQIWSADMTLSFFTRTVRKAGYEDLKPGLYFHTKPESGEKPELIKSFKVIMRHRGAYEPADFNEWYAYWVQRVLKDAAIKCLFAHKTLVSDNETEVASYQF
ncbi:hypothetical protein [Candidatus Sororendozoicomonas aggregata]|uniref:hypothetical protein n=1 Tax=Candidatus Sororendozoicomonas aggregata TaxID=3073239 RepID=UPI002ED60D23